MGVVTSSSSPSDTSLSKVFSRFTSAEGKPFICTINATGPNLLPWGTPPLTATLSDTSFPNLVIWVLHSDMKQATRQCRANANLTTIFQQYVVVDKII
jgi:hypothetical protein